jgi:hypothetical protein
VAVAYKGKALLYTCTVVSTIVTILIALNMFGILTVPGSKSGGLPLESSQFEWKYFLTFNVFPVLTLLNLVFWAFTAVSGRMFLNRPGVRQTVQFFYALVTIGLLGILVFRMF